MVWTDSHLDHALGLCSLDPGFIVYRVELSMVREDHVVSFGLRDGFEIFLPNSVSEFRGTGIVDKNEELTMPPGTGVMFPLDKRTSTRFKFQGHSRQRNSIGVENFRNLLRRVRSPLDERHRRY